jgi:DNA-binding MarR family transcriptional regulator
MSEFTNIELKPLSFQILSFLVDKEPMKAAEAAEALGLGTRQVDAAITKSLVRYGFVIREAKLTRVLKKEYNLVRATDRGKRYIEFMNQAAN